MEKSEADKPAYEPPELVDLGSAEDLTESGTSGAADGLVERASLF
jgi:hypothetical protein